MAAGLGFKTFTTGEVLTAADVNGYLMQGILVFANAAARSSAITSPQEGQYSFLKDTNALEYYDGAAWVGAPVGDITAVNAGTGITGGGASGSVTITNDMATTITAAGDIVVGTGNATYDNLPIGTTGQVLTADTTVSPYKVKWAAATGGGFTLLATATLSGNASFNFTNISQDYKHLFMRWEGIEYSNGGSAENYGSVTINNVTTTEYDFRALVWDASAATPILKIKSNSGQTSFCGTTDKYAQIILPGYGVGFSFPQTGSSGEMWFWNYKDTTTDGRIATWRSDSVNQFTGYQYFVVGRCGSKLDTAISRIDVTASGGTFTGKCLLYGVS